MRSLLLILFLIPGICTSQELSFDEDTEKIIFTEVVEVTEVKADELFSRGRQWFAESYKSANNVLQMDDARNGKLIGKAFNTIKANTYIGTETFVKMWYTIKVFVKDGRYKYEVTDIEYQVDPVQSTMIHPRVPCEDFLVGDGYYKKNGKPRPVSESYSIATQASVKSLVADLKRAMESGSSYAGDGDDW